MEPDDMKPKKRRLWLRVVVWTLVFLVVFPVLITLPWRWITPPTTAFMLMARFSDTGKPIEIKNEWAPMERISPQVAIAVVASEDQKFPTHRGFDLESIEKARAEKRKTMRGASTISQQVAKNLYLWSGRNYIRKGLETYMTVLIETLWPKRRILEVYLNIAEFGPGIYGVEAASKAFFRKSAAQLTLHEAALLAVVLPNPKRLSAARPSSYVLERAAWVETAVQQIGGVEYLKGL